MVESNLPKLRKIVKVHKADVQQTAIAFNKFSNLTKLERIVAYCIIFKSNCRRPKIDRNFGCLTYREIETASLCLAKISQRESFQKEIVSLRTDEISSTRNIAKLNPFIDSDNILRVGGRIQDSNFSSNKKTPNFTRVKSSNHEIVI